MKYDSATLIFAFALSSFLALACADPALVKEIQGTGTSASFLIEAIEIILEGDGLSLSEPDVHQIFKDHGVVEQATYDGIKVQQAQERIKSIEARNGKDVPEIRKKTTFTGPGSIKLSVIIQPGRTLYIKRITFRGNHIFSEGELKEAVGIKEGDLYNSLLFEAALHNKIGELYLERGYARFAIGEPRLQRDGQMANIEVSIQEGDVYRLGKLELMGNTVFETEALLALLDMKPGDVFSYTKVRNAMETIRKLYGSLGYINWSYLPETTIDNDSKTLAQSFTFQEDTQFRIGKIQFSSQTSVPTEVLRENFLLKERSIFSSELLERSILQLNALGIFETITEKDYEVHPDLSNGEANIVIRLREKHSSHMGNKP